MPAAYPGSRLATIVSTCCVLVLLLTGALWWVTLDRTGTVLIAHFSRTVGVYPGSDVRILGIKVGSVESVRPHGSEVVVELSVQRTVPVPDDVRAAVVSPTMVSDRYVQLTPAYESGPKVASGTVLRGDRTAVPMELDDLYDSVDQLSTTLGPEGANADGALADAIDTAARNLSGNGEQLGTTIRELGKAANTLSNSRGDLFATVENLNEFAETLVRSDGELRTFSNRLDSVSGYLAEDSGKLGAALRSLGVAMSDVQGFLADNKDLIKSNIDKLAPVTEVLVEQRAAIAEILEVAPVGATNFLNTYDAASGSFSVRGALNDLAYPPVLMVCRLIKAGTPRQLPQVLGDICEQLAPLVDDLTGLPSAAEVLGAIQQGELPPLPLPLADQLLGGLPMPTGQGGGG
ncbi:virulence factor Mce-like protein [Tamaricihabitans halophyticus]|uniref:Virulence factor Mce-like protein n=1 Tax=Tamaricihabitans halophyticus TaxID=1262583 RepID=A0A4R2Q922_9PSEU|nr:MCE family protein [Tamaricihabitans halophyticus]TCP45390.1 virulence factor Mce-like protein [Tamaricihabitans halophyticus]